MKRIYADRPNWKRATEKKFKLTYIEENQFQGYVSIMCIDKAKEPLVLEDQSQKIYLLNDGFIWMHHFPEHRNYALTTMLNERHQVVQWYFDICDGNKVSDSGIPYYDDLYLDVVLKPSGEILLLDEDELEQALVDKDITKAQYEIAYAEAYKLIEQIKTRKELLPSDSKRYLQHMLSIK